MIIALCVLGWLACSVFSYIVIRRESGGLDEEWTVGVRSLVMLLSMAGPVAAVACLAILLVCFLLDSEFGDKKANW